MKSIALIPLTVNVEVERFAKMLAKIAYNTSCTALITSKNICKNNLQVAQAADNSPLEKMLLTALDEKEAKSGKVFYIADNSDSNWTKQCIRRADKILLIGNIEEANALTAVGKTYFENPSATLDLVLEYPNDNRKEWQKTKWITPKNIRQQHHITAYKWQDFEQLAAYMIAGVAALYEENLLKIAA